MSMSFLNLQMGAVVSPAAFTDPVRHFVSFALHVPSRRIIETNVAQVQVVSPDFNSIQVDHHSINPAHVEI